MAFPFVSPRGNRYVGTRDTAAHRSVASPTDAAFHWLRRFGGRLLGPQPAKRRRPITFEPLEPRLLLAADLGFDLANHFAAEGDATLRVMQEGEGLSQVQFAELIDNRTGEAVERRQLDAARSVMIMGTRFDDTLVIDAGGAVEFGFFFEGGEGLDTLVVQTDRDTVWTIDGDNSGQLDGPVDGGFRDAEILQGDADNDDTFTFEAGGLLSGRVDGGEAGFDTLVVAGGTYERGAFVATGPDSGTIDLDGEIIRYSGLEPLDVSAVVMAEVDFVANQQQNDALLERLADGDLRIRDLGNTFEDLIFAEPTQAINLDFGTAQLDPADILNPGRGADRLTVDLASLSADINVSGEDDIVIGGTTDLQFGGDFSVLAGRDIVIEDGATIDAGGSIDLLASATGEQTFGLVEAFLQEIASTASITIGDADLQAATISLVADTTTRQTALFDIFSEGLGALIEGDLGELNDPNDTIELTFVDNGVRSLTGDPELSFDAASGSITRDGGSWLADGFQAGDIITVAQTELNDGSYTVESISADGTTLFLAADDDLADEVRAGADVTTPIPDVIRRSSGSWIADGFAEDQVIKVIGSQRNDSDSFTIAAITPLEITLLPTDTLQNESEDTTYDIAVKEAFASVAAEDVPLVSLDRDGNAVADSIRSGELQAQLQRAVAGALLDLAPSPFQYVDAMAASSIHVNADALLSATGDVTIVSSAVSDVLLNTPTLILGAAYAKSTAEARTTIGSGAVVESSNGDVVVDALVTNNMAVQVGMRAGLIFDTVTGLLQIPGPQAAFSYGEARSTSDVTVADGAAISGTNVGISAQNTNDFNVRASSQKDPTGGIGASIGVAISETQSASNVAMAGAVAAAENATVTAESRNINNDIRATGGPKKKLPIVGDKIQKTQTKLRDQVLRSESNPSALDIGAAVAISESANSAAATIAADASIAATAGRIDVGSRAEDNFKAIAVGGAKSGARVSIGGAVAVTEYANEATSTVGTGAQLTAADAVTVTADAIIPNQIEVDDDLNRILSIDYSPGSFDDSDPVSFLDSVDSFLVETSLLLDPFSRLPAYMSKNLGVDDKIATSYVAASSEAGDNGFAISGAVNVMAVTNTAEATIGEGAIVTGRTVTVAATATAESINIHGIPSVLSLVTPTNKSGGAGVGGTYSGITYDQAAIAHVADGASVDATGGNVEVRANTDNFIVNIVESGGKAAKFGISGAFAVNNFTNTTLAYIEDTAQVSASDDIIVDADTAILGINVVGTINQSEGVGFGVSLAVNEIKNETKAFIGNRENSLIAAPGTIVAGGDLQVQARSDQRLYGVAIAAAALTSGGVPDTSKQSAGEAVGNNAAKGAKQSAGINISGDVSLNFVEDTTHAYIADVAAVTVGEDLTIKAENSAFILAISGAFALDLTKGAGGSFTFAGSFTENDIDRDIRAYTRDTTITANDVSVIAETRDKILSISASAGGSVKNSAICVIGEVNLNLIDNVTRAGLWDGTDLTASGDVTINASDELILTSVAGGLGVAGRATIGAGVDVGVINRQVEATIGAPENGAAPVVDAGNVTLAASATADIVSVGAHISVATRNLGFAGAAASQTLDTRVTAAIADGTELDAGGDVIVTADDDSRFVVVGGGIGFSGAQGAGFGAGVANLNLDRVVAASVENAQVSATGNILINATATDAILGIGAAGAASGSAGIAASAVVLTLNTETRGFIAGDAATPVSADGSVSVRADSTADVDTIAGNLSFGGRAGFGASNSTIVRTDTTEAFVGAGAVVDAKGNGNPLSVVTGEAGETIVDAAFRGLSVAATSTEDLLTIAAGAAGGGSAGIAGSATVNILDETTRAFIGAGARINQTDNNAGAAAAQSVNLLAHDETTILAIAGGIAGAGSVGVGAGADVGTIDKVTEASIGAGADIAAAGNVTVQAIAGETITSVSANISIGGSAGIAGTAGVYVMDVATRAFIEGAATPAEAATVAAGGNVVVSASDETVMDVIAGNLSGAGSANVGAAAVVVTSTKETLAYIGENADVTAGAAMPGLDVLSGNFDVAFIADMPNETTSTKTGDSLTVERAEVGARPPSGSDLDFDDDGSDDTDDGSLTMQRQASAASMSGARGVIVTASNSDDIETLALSGGAAGAASINIGGNVTVTDTATSAFIADGATVDSGAAVHVAAASDHYHMGIAGVVSIGGTAGVTPGADVTVLDQATTAYIGDGSQIAADGDVTVTAQAAEDILSISAGVAGSGQAAVAGNVSVIVMDIATKAWIGLSAASDADGATVDAGGNVLVSADDTTDIDVIAGSAAVGIGAAGVGASVAVIDVDKTTEAFIGSHAAVAAAGRVDAAFETTGLAIEAASSEDVFTVAATVGGGFYAGVAGGVAVEVIDSDTRAFIGPNADVNTASQFAPHALQSVRVAADNEATVFAVGGALGAGIAGIGGAVDVGVLRNDVEAVIMGGAEVNAVRDVDVSATSGKDVTTVAAGIAAGAVGAVGSVSVWSIGTPVDASYSANRGTTEDAFSESALQTRDNGQKKQGASQEPQFDSPQAFADKMAAGDTSGEGYTFLASGYETASPFDPQTAVDSDADTIALPPGETFETGDAVVYDAGADGSAIGGLVDGEVYYVIVADENDPSVVQLAASRSASLDGEAIDLDAAAAGGSSHRLNPLAGGNTSRAGDDVDDAAPANGRITGAVNDPVAQPPGTEAAIAAGAVVRAGHDVRVAAADTVAFEALIGSISGGAGALGASVSVANVQSTVIAHIDGTVRAGNDISVNADFAEQVDATAFAGRAGAVALGAQVIVYTDSSVQQAYIADGADVQAGGTVALPSGDVAPADGDAAVTVAANAALEMDLNSIGGSIGQAAIGASVVRAAAEGTTRASLGGTVVAGRDGVAGDVVVTANVDIDADAEGKAINAALVGGEGHDARVELTPTVEASINDGAVIDATGALEVAAVTDLFGDSDAAGINLGALTVAVSIARTTITPTVRSYIGRGAEVSAEDTVRVRAAAEHDARASGTPSGGGAISGTGTETRAQIGGTVAAEVRSAADVSSGGDIELGATADNDARARGDSLAIGFAGVSGIVSRATVDGSTQAGAFGDADTADPERLAAAGSIVIEAVDVSYADAFAQAGSGGLLSGAGADAAATVTRAVRAELGGGTDAQHEAGADIRVIADGDLRAKGFSRGSAVGGLAAGVSLADATVKPAVAGQPMIFASLVPDGDAEVDAGNDIVVQALFNVDQNGTPIAGRAADAEAISSSGSLIGGSGADADAVSQPIVVARIDGLASPDEARTIQAGNDVAVEALNANTVRSVADGNNSGLFTGGSVNATATLATRASALVDDNAFVAAGRHLNVDSLATSTVRAVTEGGGGRTIGDVIEDLLKNGLSGLFNGGIPSLLNVGAAVTQVDIDSLAETRVGAGARLTANQQLGVTAKNEIMVDADSAMTSKGVTASAAIATVDVIVDPDATVVIGADAVLEADETTLSAINDVQVDAFASSFSDVDVAGSFSTAATRTDIGRGNADKSQALVRVDAGAQVTGQTRLVIEALGREKAGDILSRSRARADTGILATATATAQGSSFAQSVIETAAGSQLKSKDLQIKGETAYDIARGPDAAAEGFITKTVKVVREVVRKVTKWLPWPLDKVVEWIVDTVIEFVTVFEFSFANTDASGADDAADDRVRLDGNILLGEGAEKILVVDEAGNLVPLVENGTETGSNIIPVITDDEIIVPDITNEAQGAVRVEASRGIVDGNAILFLPKVLQRVYIENRSEKDLILQDVDVISDNAGEPDTVFIDKRGIGSGPDFEIRTLGENGSQLIVRNTSDSDIIFSKPINTDPEKQSLLTVFDISNQGGSILMDPRGNPEDVLIVAGDAAGMFREMELGLEPFAVLLETKTGGTIGTQEDPFKVRLVRGKDFPDGTLADVPAAMRASAYSNVFVDVQGVNIKFTDADPSQVVDGIVLDLESQTGNVTAQLRTGELREQVVVDGPPVPIELQGAPDLIFDDGLTRLTGDPKLTFEDGEAALSGDPLLTFEDGRSALSGDPQLTFADNGTNTVSGDPTLTFRDNGDDPDTIERDAGDWTADGFAAGQLITVSGSTGNNGFYEIADVSQTVLTLVPQDAVTDESGTGISVTSESADTISRSTGDWRADGFVVGERILVAGSSANDGTYEIAGISDDGASISLGDGDQLTAESSAGVDVVTAGSLTGNPQLTFADGGQDASDTIQRASGTWTADGFSVGQTIIVQGSSDNDGRYEIAAISDDGRTITLETDAELTDETSTGVAVVAAGQETITRSAGSWLDDGFASDQTITIGGSGANDGDYEIRSVSLDGKTLAVTPIGAATVVDAVDIAMVNASSQGNANTITRESGSWSQDGFQVGQEIVVTGTGTANDGTFTIAGIDAGTLTIEGDGLVDQMIDSGVTVQTEQGETSITRTSGSWLVDGFGVGNTITIEGSENNDGVYTIADVTDRVLELTSDATIVDERLETIVAEALAIANDGTITRGDGGSWLADGLSVGQTVRLFGTSANDGTYEVIAVTAAVLDLAPVGDSDDLQAEEVDLALLSGVSIVSEATRTITRETAFDSRPAPTVYQSIDGVALQGDVLLEVTGDLDIGVFGALSGSGLLNAPGGNVTVIATGDIFDSDADEAADILAANVTIVSETGSIGTADNPIEIDSANGTAGLLSATAATGIYIDEVDGPLTVKSATAAAGDVRLTVLDTTDTNEDLNLAEDGLISAADGSVLIRAGDGVQTAASSAITARDDVTILGDFGNADPGFGSTMVLRGAITAPDIAVFGNIDDDSITLEEIFLGGPTSVLAGNGADLITVTRLPSMTTSTDGQRDRLRLDGETGADDYVVNVTPTTPNGVFNSDYIINALDSGTDEAVDTLTLNGTNEENVFLLRKVTDIPGEAASDPAFVAHLHGTAEEVLAQVRDTGDPITVERINYDRGISRLVVNGLAGDDTIVSDDNSATTTIDGGTGDDFFQVGQVFGSERIAPDVAPEDAFATVETTRGFLSRGVSMATTIVGDDGDDTFSVYSNQAPLDLQGRAGNDTFVVRAFALAGGAGGFATTVTEVNTGAGDDMVEYNINAPVTIDGGTGFDTVVAVGTELDDTFVITEEGIFGLGLNIVINDVEAFEVDGLEGDDRVFVLSTPEGVATTIIGNFGSDEISIAGDVVGTVVVGENATSGPSDLDVAFPLQPHSLERIRGPIVIEGGVGETDRSLRNAIILPTETDSGPIPVDGTTDETLQIDVLNVFNDDSTSDDQGVLTATNLSGLGMATAPVTVPGSNGNAGRTIAAGITYAGLEIVEILLGQGNDSLEIGGTLSTDAVHGGLTVVHGGGGDDLITVSARAAPLVIYGDTSEDGVRYGSTPSERSINGNAFDNPGADVINASASQQSIIAFGGPQDDIIIGSQAGDDLAGGDGNDAVDGQAGDDRIYGDFKFNVARQTRALSVVQSATAGDDDLIGGLGNDDILGNAGNDTILGDVGLIFRAVQPDGSPKLNANGSQHRDIVLLEAADVTDVIDIDSTRLRDLDGIARDLMAADMAVVTGAYDAAGNKVLNADNGAWDTNLLLLDLREAGADVIDAGTGDDVVFAQRGDDHIWGDDGDDVLFGDGGFNQTHHTDLPQVASGLQLSNPNAVGGLQLDANHIVLPAMNAGHDALSASFPTLARPNPNVPGFAALIGDSNTVPRSDGSFLQPLLSIVTDLLHDPSVMPGNDVIHGGDGNDLIAGDALQGFSPLITGLREIDEAVEDVRNTVLALSHELHNLSLANALLDIQFLGGSRTDAATGSGGNDIHIAGDSLFGDAGDDRIFGDDAFLLAPATADVPALDPDDLEGTLEDAALAFHGFLHDLRLAIVDFGMVVEAAQVQTLEAIVAASGAADPGGFPKPNEIADPDIYDLFIENDVIDGGIGDDRLVGDDGFHFVVTADGSEWEGLVDQVDRRTLRDVERALKHQERDLERDLAGHVDGDHADVRGRVPGPNELKFNPFEFQFDKSLGNDSIAGNDGSDLIIGDYDVSVTVVFAATPDTVRDMRDAERSFADAVKETASYFRHFQHDPGNATFKNQPFNRNIDANTYKVRNHDNGIRLAAGNDDLRGDAGADTIVGDNQARVAAVAADDAGTPLDLGRQDLAIKTSLKDFRRFLEHPANLHPSRFEVIATDTINGGIGSDLLVAKHDEVVSNGGDRRTSSIVASDLAGSIIPAQSPWLEQFWLDVLSAEAWPAATKPLPAPLLIFDHLSGELVRADAAGGAPDASRTMAGRFV